MVKTGFSINKPKGVFAGRGFLTSVVCFHNAKYVTLIDYLRVDFSLASVKSLLRVAT